MSRSPKKAGGLNFNPLLSRTEAPEADAHADAIPALPPRTPAAAMPTKFTFYFTPEQLDRLDAAWTAFRRRSRGGGPRISKSLFVRVALDRLLDEFDRDPEAVAALLGAHGDADR